MARHVSTNQFSSKQDISRHHTAMISPPPDVSAEWWKVKALHYISKQRNARHLNTLQGMAGQIKVSISISP
jgi:hypothetical protein